MIEKPIGPGQSRKELTGEIDAGDIEVILPPEEDEDGVDGADLETDAEQSADDAHDVFYKNLAEDMDEGLLGTIASEIAEMYDNDLRSRDEWVKTYEEGVGLLGLGLEERTEPWDGACGVFHPLMAEAAVRFQAESITEIFSAQGICKATIIGKTDELKEKAAKRVENDMNWRITTQMKEYRPEHERMLWNLAISGSSFKKVYFDPSLDRQTSVFVSAMDLVVPYGSTDISTTPRISHRMLKSPNDVKKLQAAGFYRDIDLPDAVKSSKRTAQDKITGTVAIDDDRHEIIEMQVDYEIEGYEDVDADGEMTGIMVPFVITFDLQSKEILAIYRNWKPTDQTKQRVQHFVHYLYIPGFGFYGMGLVHLVGGFAKSATSILRQLIDSGTLANLPAGFKTKGIRVQRDSDPLQPGEFRDVDVPSGTLQQNLMTLPFKEPSQTLLALFNEIVEEGRRMAAVSDLNAADMNQQAPVGTTLAILERSLKVMTAIQARLHASLKEELGILHCIIKDNLPEDYDYDVDEGRQVKQADYELAEIIPVSDPNAATMSQRVVQYQAVLQMAEKNPVIYDMVELNRQMLVQIGIKNVEKLIPSSKDQTPVDPVTENMNIINGKPVKAFAYQDHEAHLKVHMAAQQDPHMQQILGQMPNAQQIASVMNAHLSEHVAFEYRKRVEEQLGAPMPQGDEKMSPEVEKQLSVVMAEASQQLLQVHKTQAAAEAAQQAAQDPILQQQKQQLDNDAEKNQIAKYKVDKDFELGRMKILAEGAKVDEVHKHEDQAQARAMLAKAAEFDATQQGQGVDPEKEAQLHAQQMQHQHEAHNQQMAQQSYAHLLDLAQKHQGLQQADTAHEQKTLHVSEAHKQKMKHAEEQRLINAAMAAAKPHMEKSK